MEYTFKDKIDALIVARDAIYNANKHLIDKLSTRDIDLKLVEIANNVSKIHSFNKDIIISDVHKYSKRAIYQKLRAALFKQYNQQKWFGYDGWYAGNEISKKLEPEVCQYNDNIQNVIDNTYINDLILEHHKIRMRFGERRYYDNLAKEATNTIHIIALERVLVNLNKKNYDTNKQ